MDSFFSEDVYPCASPSEQELSAWEKLDVSEKAERWKQALQAGVDSPEVEQTIDEIVAEADLVRT